MSPRLGGKESELVREIERYQLEIVGLTSTHCLGSGTQLLEKGWTLFHPGLAYGERRRAAVGLLIASWRPWEGYWKVLQLGTPSFYWGTSMLMRAVTALSGGV